MITSLLYLEEPLRQLRNSTGAVINIVSIGIGLVGAVFLAINLSKYIKGDASSDDSLIKVGIGLISAAIIIQIAKISFFN